MSTKKIVSRFHVALVLIANHLRGAVHTVWGSTENCVYGRMLGTASPENFMLFLSKMYA